MRVTVRVVPRSSRNELRRLLDGNFKAWVTAPPVDGAANLAIIALLAEEFKVPKSAVSLVQGAASKSKVFEIDL